MAADAEGPVRPKETDLERRRRITDELDERVKELRKVQEELAELTRQLKQEVQRG